LKGRIGAAALTLTVGTLAALGAGCGGSDGKDSERAERSGTPRQAIKEIAATRAGLHAALATYRGGDAKRAGTQVGDAYLAHFEHVEGPLERVNEDLTEELEDGIRETLRNRIEAGAPAAEIARLVRRIDAQLDEAAAALR